MVVVSLIFPKGNVNLIALIPCVGCFVFCAVCPNRLDQQVLKQIMKKNCNHENAKWAQLLTIDANNKYITSLAPSMSRQWTREKDLYSSIETIIQSRTIEVIG